MNQLNRFLRLVSFGFVGLLTIPCFSCSHGGHPQDSVGDEARAPASFSKLSELEIRPNQEVYWGGSIEKENEIFRRMAEQIREVIHRQTGTLRGQEPQRGFHAKSQGCVRGLMMLDPKRDARLRYGVFGNGKKAWKLWARFSNGAGWRDSDSAADVRGLALKLINVPGEKLSPLEKETQDMIMITTPVGFGSDSDVFMRFADANARSVGLRRQTDLLHFAAKNTSAASAISSGLIDTQVKGEDSLTHLQYWSGAPYRLGPNQAMKYTVKPTRCEYPEPSLREKIAEKKDSYLSEDLALRAKNGFCMGVFIQLQSSDPKKTPIEDSSKKWDETDAPFMKVADLIFQPQDITDKTTHAMCDSMSFNPWHSIAAHQPLGNQNRARKWVYEASKEERKGASYSTIQGWEIH